MERRYSLIIAVALLLFLGVMVANIDLTDTFDTYLEDEYQPDP